MEPPEHYSATHIAILWRGIAGLLGSLFAVLFFTYSLQQLQPIPPWLCWLTAFTMLHRLFSLYALMYRVSPLSTKLRRLAVTLYNRYPALFVVDIVLCIGEVGAYIQQACIISWSIQDLLSLYQIFSVIGTIFWTIVYICTRFWDRPSFKSTHETPTKEVLLGFLFPGEHKLVAAFRLLATGSVMYFIISFSLVNVVVEPLLENNLPPIKETHSRIFPLHLWIGSCQGLLAYSCKPPSFLNVVVARPTISALGADKAVEIFSAVKVTTFSDRNTTSSCGLVRQPIRLVGGQLIDVNVTWNVLSLGCTYQGAQPQILVTVNFTQLDANQDSPFDFPFVHVMMGNTNDTEEVVRMTETPAVVLPGENIVGFAKQHVRQRFKSRIYSTLGMSNLYKTAVVSEVVGLRPDPQASKSPLILSSTNFSTIRIMPLINIGDWKVIREYRDLTSLKGLSGVGGLWTLFGGFFSLSFGVSLLRSLFGSKPLSISGLIHHIPFIRIEQGDKYNIGPENSRDVQAFISFMVDHFVDINFASKMGLAVADKEDKLSENMEVLPPRVTQDPNREEGEENNLPTGVTVEGSSDPRSPGTMRSSPSA